MKLAKRIESLFLLCHLIQRVGQGAHLGLCPSFLKVAHCDISRQLVADAVFSEVNLPVSSVASGLQSFLQV